MLLSCGRLTYRGTVTEGCPALPSRDNANHANAVDARRTQRSLPPATILPDSTATAAAKTPWRCKQTAANHPSRGSALVALDPDPSCSPRSTPPRGSAQRLAPLTSGTRQADQLLNRLRAKGINHLFEISPSWHQQGDRLALRREEDLAFAQQLRQPAGVIPEIAGRDEPLLTLFPTRFRARHTTLLEPTK